MEELMDAMKRYHATNFSFYLKLHFFHWNVEGMFFSQLHDFFGDLYNEVWTAQDDIAERIRTIKGYAPGSLQRMKDLSLIDDQIDVPAAQQMIVIAMEDNEKVIQTLTEAYKLAEAANELGLANFLQDRLDIHKKHEWMLRATLK
jgi:starvation-inducible DNA-binding protein